MEPTLISGDVVFVDPDASPGMYEDLVVLNIGSVLHVCRVVMAGQRVWLIHDNPTHKDVFLPTSQVTIRGTVKWIERVNSAAESA